MDSETYLCEEIVIEILTRLPAQSLIRFMAVCRLWKSIITSSPEFRLVLKRPPKLLAHTARQCYALDEEEENRLMFETYFPLKADTAVVIGSDKGLLCISIKNPHRLIIWNPFIRKHVIIPDHHTVDDKSTSEYACGFGATTNGDYKYVRFESRHNGGFEKEVNIYSMKSGRWRTKYLDSWYITQGVGGIMAENCALVRGRLHWICDCGKEIYPFELEDEVFENKIMVPVSTHKNVNVAVIRESLAVTTSEIGQNHSTAVCVWVMEEYGDANSWNKKWNIVLEEELCRVERNMVHLLKDDELLLGLRRFVYPYKLKLVTFNSKTMKTCDFGGSLESKRGESGFTNYYKESLILLAHDYHATADQITPQGRRNTRSRHRHRKTSSTC